jgi:hypothetical protein
MSNRLCYGSTNEKPIYCPQGGVYCSYPCSGGKPKPGFPNHIPPSAENVDLAREIASDLVDIATDGRASQWRSYDITEPKLSQSDRLVILAARLGRISELLRARYVYAEEAEQ